MVSSKEQLLQRLKELQIDFAQYDHPEVLTVEAQAKYVGHLKGGLSKNLFLKDKKHRYYIVSALSDTKVDLKVLSQRLGLGKGGLRMAPEEALGEILKVPVGCVTPFAAVHESARYVSLLLDQKFKSQEYCFFHPLSNDMSISLNAFGLDKFLKSIGRDPAYVDLEANPPVGKDQPPDLAALVPSEAPVPQDLQDKVVADKSDLAANNKPTVVTAKPVKPSKSLVKERPVDAVNMSSFADPEKFVNEILEKTSAAMISEIKDEKLKEQTGTVLSNSVKKHLTLELQSLATMFKNLAYTDGFVAGKNYQPKRM